MKNHAVKKGRRKEDSPSLTCICAQWTSVDAEEGCDMQILGLGLSRESSLFFLFVSG